MNPQNPTESIDQIQRNIYYYDVNATSNFVASAPAVVGSDPTARFADYIARVAQTTAEWLAPSFTPLGPQTPEERA